MALPSLDDAEYIEIIQQYPSRLCKRMTTVLRKFASGFIACKFSVFVYLLITILPGKTTEEILDLITQIDVRRIGSSKNKRVDYIFMRNQRREPDKDIVINHFSDIVFESNIALLGIVENEGLVSGEIFHYFLILRRPEGYFIVSSYGSSIVSIRQYETRLHPESLNTFVKSLQIDKSNPTPLMKRIDIPRIRGFMRYHFLNPEFKLHERKSVEDVKDPEFKNTPKDISDEIGRYTRHVSRVIQFGSILVDLQDELTQIQLAQEHEGGMRKKMTIKGKHTHYVYSRRNHHSFSLPKK
uniref:Uncharacterized protein n=1 Tax=viral metagenome TaxID=1070528 RepID=A0A6C0HX76_9ZZZZ